MMTAQPAFSVLGVELEYMIVDRDTLAIRPIADALLKNESGEPANEQAHGNIARSNELTLHLLEIKNKRPVPALFPVRDAFQREVAGINRQLEAFNACLMPAAMHPWMDPLTETHLWPHADAEIYRAYDRIFGCRQHGFANLQSMHLNLPFQDDAQFARLHAAVRLILPILPALATSSPILEGRPTGVMDNRLAVYLGHQRKVPATMGQIIPDTVSSQVEYQTRILLPMYEAISPFDPLGILKHEWLNARGAIPRFERMALEIRLLDMQEYPLADLAVASAITAVTHRLYQEETAGLAAQQAYPTHRLAELLHACIQNAEQAVIEDPDYLALLGLPPAPCRVAEAWRRLIEAWWQREPEQRENWSEPLNLILEHGPLARRILRAAGPDCSRHRQQAIYRALCDCLGSGRPFPGLD